jgi:hypothetical protein
MYSALDWDTGHALETAFEDWWFSSWDANPISSEFVIFCRWGWIPEQASAEL